MKLNIKNMKDNSKFSIEIDDDKTVRALKQQIAAMFDCKISNIRLVYTSSVLQNSQTLASLALNPQKTVYLYFIERNGKNGVKEGDRKKFFELIQQKEYADSCSNQNVVDGINEIIQGLEMKSKEGDNSNSEIYQLLQELVTKLSSKYEEMYHDKLIEMEEIGIASKENCLEALKVCSGNVDDAVTWIIDNNKIY